jgi:lysyl-tRNA synthetase class 2
MDNDALRWRQELPGGKSRLDILRARHAIRRVCRDWLDAQGFIEIDSPLLVRGTTPDPAVESFAVGDRYLVTSTEYQAKRLAMGGLERLYTLTQNFRMGDTGAYRNPEFTMLEWGRVGVGVQVIEADAEGFVTAAMESLGLSRSLSYQGKTIDMSPPWERLSVADAIRRFTGTAFAAFDLPSCRAAVEALGVAVRDDWKEDRDFLFAILMDEIQPLLGRDRPVFLREWPLYQTTSAAAGEDGLTADRSELFIAGIELSDGFAAVADAAMQKYFFALAAERRKDQGLPDVTLDARYVDAMREATLFGAGMAMGFDRLVMLLTDQPRLSTVLAFGWDEL